MKRVIFFASLLLLLNGEASAGWYKVINYVGTIGQYPIHLSLQKYDNFGDGLTLRGSYYYDKHLSPIALYGKQNTSGEAELCEGLPEKSTIDTSACQFKLKLSENGANGTWRSNGKTLEVALNFVASLDDTDFDKGQSVKGLVEIPFLAQAKDHLFVGIYENGVFGAARIKVINKRTKKVMQEIVHDDDCGAGSVMTVIYDNVEKSVQAKNNEEQIMIECEGKMAAPLFYTFKQATQKFELEVGE